MKKRVILTVLVVLYALNFTLAQTVKLDVPFFSQKDKKWEEEPLGLGDCSETIGSKGCFITTTAMVLKYYEVDTDPKKFNDWLRKPENAGYVGCNFVWKKTEDYAAEFGCIVTIDKYDKLTNQKEDVKAEINKRHPVLALTDYPYEEHWLTVVGYTKNDNDIDLWIHDPLETSGPTKFSNTNYKLANNYRFFTGPIPSIPSLQVGYFSDGWHADISPKFLGCYLSHGGEAVVGKPVDRGGGGPYVHYWPETGSDKFYVQDFQRVDGRFWMLAYNEHEEINSVFAVHDAILDYYLTNWGWRDYGPPMSNEIITTYYGTYQGGQYKDRGDRITIQKFCKLSDLSRKVIGWDALRGTRRCHAGIFSYSDYPGATIYEWKNGQEQIWTNSPTGDWLFDANQWYHFVVRGQNGTKITSFTVYITEGNYQFSDFRVYPPQNLSARTISSSEIYLDWQDNKNPNGTQYKIYRNGSHIKSTTYSYYSDKGLSQNTTYNYQVSAIYDNKESEKISVSATTYRKTSYHISVNSPISGEYVIGSQMFIGYTFTIPGNQVKIELSRNGGSAWQTLWSSTYADGGINWAVSGPASNNCKIKISCVANPSISGVSNTFAIIESSSQQPATFPLTLEAEDMEGGIPVSGGKKLITPNPGYPAWFLVKQIWFPQAGEIEIEMIAKAEAQVNNQWPEVLIKSTQTAAQSISSTEYGSYFFNKHVNGGEIFVEINLTDNTKQTPGHSVIIDKIFLKYLFIEEPALSVSTTSLNFGKSSTQKTFNLSNTGTGVLSFSMYENTQGHWVESMNPASGRLNAGQNTTITVGVSRACLSFGTHTGTIKINSNGGDKNINVSITKQETPIPVLSVFPTSLNFGKNQSQRTLNITNTGTGNLSWSISNNRNWIACNPASGSNNKDVRVTIDRSLMDYGTHSGTLTISSNGGTKTITLTAIKEEAATPILWVSTISLDFDSLTTQKTLDISNAGQGTLTWSLSTNDNWINFNPISGSEDATIIITVDRSQLDIGTHQGSICINSNVGPGIIRITVTKSQTGVNVDLPNDLLLEFKLFQSYPNPFNPTTTIKYQLPKAAKVSLKVYNLFGQEIITLVDEHQPAGYYSATWNAQDATSGMYFYILIAGGFKQTKKMVLMK